MPIKYQPLGLPTTSSFAEAAKGAVTGSIIPQTASFAEFTTNEDFKGPKGPSFKTIIGKVVPI